MATKENYREVRDEISKDAGKALAFFFIGVPLAIAAIVFFIMFPVRTAVFAAVAAAVWYAVKKHGREEEHRA